MIICEYDKILLCREILRKKLKTKYGNLYRDDVSLETFFKKGFQEKLRENLDSENQIGRFNKMIEILLDTEKCIDKSTERKDTGRVMNKLFGDDLIIPEKYRGIIEKLREDITRPILREMLCYGYDVRKVAVMNVSGKQLLQSLKNQLSDRSFCETPDGKIKNIHTNEIISFDDYGSSIRTIILGLQKIASEEGIDALLDEESIREGLGIDVVSYEVAGLESIRQDALNQIRVLQLSHNQIPDKLPEDMEDEVYIAIRQRLQEASSDIESYRSQIKYGDGIAPAIPYKTRIYHRQGWKRAYK